MKPINKEKYNQIIDEVYENYLTNFKRPECPMGLDVQPDYYQPMTKEWFVKSVKEKGSRGDEFSKKWGLKIYERDLSLGERLDLWYQKNQSETGKRGMWEIDYVESYEGHKKLNSYNTPTKIIILTYDNETMEIYE